MKILLLLFLVFFFVDAVPIADRVESLPLLGRIPRPRLHYSGYLNGTAACSDDTCFLHYWFVTGSKRDNQNWTERPLLVWLNGGPGASSLVGLLQEIGPMLITPNKRNQNNNNNNSTIGFAPNPYSWVSFANLLVLESPVGVGFSYCGRMLETKTHGDDDDSFPSCRNVTDDSTAAVALAALVDFFSHKFPELQSNDMFLTGESYAGVYVPLLARAIVAHNQQNVRTAPPIRLQGLAVGDPCTDNTAQAQSRNPLWYAHQKGLVDDAIYATLTSDPCNATDVILQAQLEDDEDDDEGFHTRWMQSVNAAFHDVPTCRIAWRKFLLASSNGIDGHWPQRYIDRYSLYGSVTTAVDDATEAYLQRPDVQRALHVRTDLPDPWKKHAIPAHFHYQKQYSACNRHVKEGTRSMIDIYRSLLPHISRIWIFNGDADPCVSYEGTRTSVRRIGKPEASSYRPWFYHASAVSRGFVLPEAPLTFGADLPMVDAGVQFGGEVTTYADGLVFLTVHGAGHMVPMVRPKAALHMLHKFITGEPLSPPLPSNATLLAMNASSFDSWLDHWTDTARSAPYVVIYDY